MKLLRKNKKPAVKSKPKDDEFDLDEGSTDDVIGYKEPPSSKRTFFKPQREGIPDFAPGDPNDPFNGRPRVFFKNRSIALVQSDAKNWTIYLWALGYNVKTKQATTTYKTMGFFSSFYGAVKQILECETLCQIQTHDGKDLERLVQSLTREIAALNVSVEKLMKSSIFSPEKA